MFGLVFDTDPGTNDDNVVPHSNKGPSKLNRHVSYTHGHPHVVWGSIRVGWQAYICMVKAWGVQLEQGDLLVKLAVGAVVAPLVSTVSLVAIGRIAGVHTDFVYKAR